MKEFKTIALTLNVTQGKFPKQKDYFCCEILDHAAKGRWVSKRYHNTPHEAVYDVFCNWIGHHAFSGCLKWDTHQAEPKNPLVVHANTRSKPRIYRKNGVWQYERALQAIDTGNFIAKIEAPFRALNIQSMQFVERLNQK